MPMRTARLRPGRQSRAGHDERCNARPACPKGLTMATFNKFSSFVEALAEKVHNLGADTLRVALSDVAPVASNTVLASITQIAAGNGYSAGGTATTITSSSQTSGTYKLVITDVTFTASGGSIAQFRYVVL